MKIYFITSKLNFETAGGSVEEFDLMMRTLQKFGNEVIAVTAFSESNRGHLNVPYRVIEERIPKRDLIGIQRGVYDILRRYEKDADFFHVDGHNFLYGAGLYRRRGGKVPVSAFFNMPLGAFSEESSTLLGTSRKSAYKRIRHAIRWFFERTIGMWLANAIDLKSFITPQYQEMYEHFGLRCDNALVLADPTDFPKIMRENAVDEYSYRSRINHEPPLRIFFSSRMVPGKGFDLLLKGFSEIKNKKDLRLVLGGDGPERSKIEALAQELDIHDRIEFLGWMTTAQLYDQFKKADIFVQIGWRKEGASMTLLKAMAFGVPSVVPTDSGLAWQTGNSALTAVNRDHEGVARAIERLATDQSLRAELSKNCFVRLTDDQMNHEKVIRIWLNAMEKIKGLK